MPSNTIPGSTADQEDRFVRRRIANIPSITDSIMKQYHQAVQQMEATTCIHCLVDLSDGYQIEVHRLLAF